VRRLGPISKHGNTYVRMLLIHGARSALRAGTVTQHPDDLRTWARAKATTSRPSRWPTSWLASAGGCGAINVPSNGATRAKEALPPSCTVDHDDGDRSDRRGDEPITRVALGAALSDWHPARDFPSSPGPAEAHRTGRSYDCSRPRRDRRSLARCSGGVQIRLLDGY